MAFTIISLQNYPFWVLAAPPGKVNGVAPEYVLMEEGLGHHTGEAEDCP